MARHSSKGEAMTDANVTQVAGGPAEPDGAADAVATRPRQEIAEGSALSTLAEWAEAKLQEYETDNARVMEDIVGRILAGTTTDDILGAGTSNTVSGEKAVGRPFLAHSFRITRSGYEGEGTMPWYANIDGEMLDTRERLIVNTGAPKILAALMALERAGEWPIAVQIEGATTSAGYEVLGLTKAQTPEGRPF